MMMMRSRSSIGVVVSVAAVLLLLLLLPSPSVAAPKPAAPVPNGRDKCDWQGPRKDCGYAGIDRKACERKGCCWSPLKERLDESFPPVDADTHAGPTLSLPSCFHANAAAPLYDFSEGLSPPSSSSSFEEGGDNGNEKDAEFAGRAGGPLGPSARRGVARLVRGVQPELGPDFSRVAVAVVESYGSSATAATTSKVKNKKKKRGDILRIKLTDAEDPSRWEVPPSLLDDSAGGAGKSDVEDDGGGGDDDGDDGVSSPEPPLLRAEIDDALRIKVTRRTSSSSSSQSPPPPLFDTSSLRLVLKDQYLELSTKIPPDSSLFGLGERISSTGLALRRSGRPLALWNRDCTDYPDLNLYGSFPFVLELRRDGTASGLLLWNSNAMDAVFATDSRLSFRATGGVLDLYVLAGPTPADVVEQLTRLVGRPAMPPLWALGFHQSKYGYQSVDELDGVRRNYSRAAIPLDAVWGDIDYMDRWKDFTFDPVNYPQDRMREFVDALHDEGRRFVPILDPGIKMEVGYAPYDDAAARGLFLRDVTGAPYIGEVWPGACHFPDFMHPEALDWWARHVEEFYDKVPFDGLWIDMNEASNFCTGHVCEVPPEGIDLDYLSPGAGAKPYFEFGLEPPRCALQCWSLEPFLKQWLLQEQLGGDGGDVGEGRVARAEVGGGDSRKAAADAAAAAAAASDSSSSSSAAAAPAPPPPPPPPSTSNSSSSSPSSSTSSSSSSSSVGGALGALVKHVVAGRGGATARASRAWQEPGTSRGDWQRLMRADTPPYSVANNNVRLPLSFRTLPVTLRGHGGVLQYDAHNLYGLSQAAVTARALRKVFRARKGVGGEEEKEKTTENEEETTSSSKSKKSFLSFLLPSSSSAPSSSAPASSSSSSSSLNRSARDESYDRRPFILTRSSFLGAGAHSAHWLGDNAATWDDLRWSVTGVLEAGLYGNPLPGADVCGFLLDATPELCARWIAAGSFHPFVRDHSDLMAANQELYRWPETARAARRALGARYRLLPYLYTGSFAATRRGCPLVRPLWFGWPAEPAAVRSVASGEQWLVGDALLVSPAMRPNATEVEAYFPPGEWYDHWTGERVVEFHEGGKKKKRVDETGAAKDLSTSVLHDRRGDDTSSVAADDDGNGDNNNGNNGNGVRARTSTLSAPLDHVPLHLAGGIALLSAAGGEAFVPLTTAEAWRAPLEATVALPGEDDDAPSIPSSSSPSVGGTFARCGAGAGPALGSPHAPLPSSSAPSSPSSPSSSAPRVAWGRSFRDGDRGDDAGALSKGSWALVSGWEHKNLGGGGSGGGGGGGGGDGGGGGVRITLSKSGEGWDPLSSSSSSSSSSSKTPEEPIDNCSGGPWPRLADVRVLGVRSEPDPASFELSAWSLSSSGSSASASASSAPASSSSSRSSSTLKKKKKSLKPRQVSFDPSTGVLFVKGLDARLECGPQGEAAGVELTWRAKGSGGEGGSSKKDEL